MDSCLRQVPSIAGISMKKRFRVRNMWVVEGDRDLPELERGDRDGEPDESRGQACYGGALQKALGVRSP